MRKTIINRLNMQQHLVYDNGILVSVDRPENRDDRFNWVNEDFDTSDCHSNNRI